MSLPTCDEIDISDTICVGTVSQHLDRKAASRAGNAIAAKRAEKRGA